MTTEYNGIYAIIGPPGTGKTTFLSNQTRKIVGNGEFDPEASSPVVLCSLTRTAAAEIAGRGLPIPRFQVGTLHAHAFRQLGKTTVAESKVAEWNAHRPDLRLAKQAPDVDEPGSDAFQPETIGDSMYERYGLLRHRMADRAVWPESVRIFAKAWEAWKSIHGYIDFTDMIEHALHDVPFAPGNPQVVIADECQDLSALEFALLKKWGKTAGALMIAGDPWQALYVWRGAHPEMFLDPEIPADHRKVLGQSYRVSRAVHGMATGWIKNLSDYQPIEYQPRDDDGYTERIYANWARPEDAIKEATRLLDSGLSVMFAGTCSYMIEPTLRVLRKRGIPFCNPWRAKKGHWNPLGKGRGIATHERIVDYLRPDPVTWNGPDAGSVSRMWTRSELAEWIQLLKVDGVLNRGAKRMLESYDDDESLLEASIDELNDVFNPESFGSLMDAVFKTETIGRDRSTKGSADPMLEWLITRMLDSKRRVAEFPLNVAHERGGSALREKPRFYVGTVHSFKGAEADVVFLFPDVSPAGMREWASGGTARDSVVRTFYVGITRARKAVYLCEPASRDCAINLTGYLNPRA